jgi:prevent-host-death family protein
MIKINQNNINLTTLKTKPGEVIDRVRLEPVTVERYGRPAAVIISPETYNRFEKLEDAHWLQVLESRRKEGGYLSADDSLKAIQDLLIK